MTQAPGPTRHPDRLPPRWQQLCLIWRWPLALVLCSLVLAQAAQQLLSRPLPVGVNTRSPLPVKLEGSIPITVRVESALPVAVRAQGPEGLQTRVVAEVSRLNLPPVAVQPLSLRPVDLHPVTVRPVSVNPVTVEPLQATVRADQPLPVSGTVAVQELPNPMKVEIQRDSSVLDVEVKGIPFP
ncbi:hypothetical protein VB716_15860 [Synechococcus sp. CCY9201]|uniref:hypothetical protein n=1 Tax=Synechococcus sp. CCY9201 TaxID=174697 RepID=UPI002B200FAE|nr:hypothetical protein [Synechococcus sp. CCY9201]MEA5475694.1 hypothetical protein [Synechococcus sp. CCY9201]